MLQDTNTEIKRADKELSALTVLPTSELAGNESKNPGKPSSCICSYCFLVFYLSTPAYSRGTVSRYNEINTLCDAQGQAEHHSTARSSSSETSSLSSSTSQHSLCCSSWEPTLLASIHFLHTEITEAIKIQPQTRDRNCMIYSSVFKTKTSTEGSHGVGAIQRAPELISQIQILSN